MQHTVAQIKPRTSTSFGWNVMVTRDSENEFESEDIHCALPGLAGVGGLCACYRVFWLPRNFIVLSWKINL